MVTPQTSKLDTLQRTTGTYLNGFVVSALVASCATTLDFNIWLVMIPIAWAAMLLIFQLIGQNLSIRNGGDFIIPAVFAVLTCVTASLTKVPAMILIVPVFVHMVKARSRIVFFIPVVVVAIFDCLNPSSFNWLHLIISSSVLLIAMKLNQSFLLLQMRLSETEQALARKEKQTEIHLSLLANLSQGNFSSDQSLPKEDVLGNTLTEFGCKIKAAAENEKRRAWEIGGLNELNTIFRSSSSLEGKYNALISFLVKYTSANQGGFFLLNNQSEEQTLELRACYAYEKHRMVTRQIEIGTTMLGQCVLEKQIIYLENIPAHYVHITSGLGLATPTSLVMVPVIYNEQVLGVVELASFKKIEKHQIEFLEKAAIVMGGALLSIQSAATMKTMLEDSQQLSEELRAQQEEVRQNIEELEATQEHLVREGKELEKVKEELRKAQEFLNLVIDSVPIPVFVKNRQHQMVLTNKAVCELNGLSKDQMIGKSDYDFFPKEQADIFWNLEEGIFESKTGTEKLQRATRHGHETMSIDKKIVIETQDGECYLVGINIDVTDRSFEPAPTERFVKDDSKVPPKPEREHYLIL